jgi:hypothetical protein
MNEETRQQVYFIKMVNLTTDSEDTKSEIRKIHLIAVAGEQFAKWEACLRLNKDPGEPDKFFSEMKQKVINKIRKELKEGGEGKAEYIRKAFGYK